MLYKFHYFSKTTLFMKNLLCTAYFFLAFSFVHSYGQCNLYPILSLGSDTVICSGANLTLQSPNVYQNYLWSNGATTPTLSVNTGGSYSVTVNNVGANLVVNGDFELGNVNFTSAYIYGTGGAWGLLSSEGQYAIATSPSLAHNNFSFCPDHTTTGPGNMLVANGSGTANTAVWCQTIAVDPGTDYLFSTWIANALNDANISNLQLFVNGVQIGPVFSTLATACQWTEFSDVWNSGLATSADLCIRNQNFTTSGNDFVIDDISFRPVCLQNDTIQVVFDNLTVNAGPDILLCANETENLIASSSVPGTTLIWETGAIGSVFTPIASGTYTVHAISNNGCYVADSAIVTMVAMPWDMDTVIAEETTCGLNNGYVSVITNGTFNDLPYYTWNGPGATSPSLIHASVWTNLGTGWYYISIESDGCYRYDSIQVTLLNPPISQFTASANVGCEPMTVTFTNTSQNTSQYVWNFDNGQIVNANSLASQTQTFSSSNVSGGTALVQLIASQGTCSDTAEIAISILVCGCNDPLALNYNPLATSPSGTCLYPVPTAEVYNIFTPDGDNENSLFFVKTTNAEKTELIILNRWGNVIFEETGLQPSWNGQVNGVSAPDGVYFFKYTVTGVQGDSLSGDGFVQLTRK